MYKVKKEFSRFANSYNKFNIIQREVSIELIKLIDFEPKKILDLGSGTGEVVKNIDWEYDEFIGVDISKEMCEIHPKSENIKLLNLNFEDEKIYSEKFDIVISASAIQWAEDLNKLFENISKVTNRVAFAIFTSNTFKSIHKLAKIDSPIYSKEELLNSLNRYFEFDYEIKSYELSFETKMDIFRYIKKSGVSGGVQKLSFKETKRLINNYPHNYLEFEILFVVGRVKS